MTNATSKTPEDHLFCLLRDAEDGNAAPLRDYLDTTPPPPGTNDLLHAIAERATPTMMNALFFWGFLLVFAFFVVMGVLRLTRGDGLWESFKPEFFHLMMFFWFIGYYRKWAYRKGRAALLHLAERNDLRALPLLLAEWQAFPLPMLRAWNDRVADALARLLDEAEQEHLPLNMQDRLQKAARMLVFVSALGSRFGFTSADLSPASAYLAVSILRRLHTLSGPDNRDLLTLVAADTRTLPPRRAWVRDAVRALLPAEGMPAVVPTAAQPTVTAAPASTNVQTLNRS